MKKIALFASLLAFSLNCFSAQVSKDVAAQKETPVTKETVDELFRVISAQKMMDSVYGQMDELFNQMVQGMNATEAQKPILDSYYVKYQNLVKQEMSWDKLKDPVAEVYAGVFTESELKEVIRFYKSPVGQKVLVKMPEVMHTSMGVVQNNMKNVMAKINQLQKELQDALDKQALEQQGNNKQ